MPSATRAEVRPSPSRDLQLEQAGAYDRLSQWNLLAVLPSSRKWRPNTPIEGLPELRHPDERCRHPRPRIRLRPLQGRHPSSNPKLIRYVPRVPDLGSTACLIEQNLRHAVDKRDAGYRNRFRLHSSLPSCFAKDRPHQSVHPTSLPLHRTLISPAAGITPSQTYSCPAVSSVSATCHHTFNTIDHVMSHHSLVSIAKHSRCQVYAVIFSAIAMLVVITPLATPWPSTPPSPPF